LSGVSLARQGEWPEALRAFERSYALRAHPVASYNIAYSERALGHYTRAQKFFRRSLDEHTAAALGTLPDDLLVLAKSYLVEVEKRLSHVSVRVRAPMSRLSVDGRPLDVLSKPGAPRLVLVAGTRDGRGAEQPPQPSFDLLIDPGRHFILLSRPGIPDEVRTESFEAGESVDLVLGTEPPRAPSTATAGHAAFQQPVSTNDGKTTWMWISYGVGGAGLIVGSIFGALMLDKASYLSDRCGTKATCDTRYQGDIDTGNRDATIANVGFAVAAAGGIAGTYFLLTRSHGEAAEKNASTGRVTPLLGPTMVGASVRF
jgi:hypothetical protein